MLELSVPPRTNSAPLHTAKLRLSDKTLTLLLLAIALLSLLPTLGITRIIDPSDGFYAESARELLESNNFIVPTLNYAPYNDKPILTHWLVAATYSVLGVSEFASRLPSALCASALCVATFAFARRYTNSRTAWFAGLTFFRY
jgi:4-amino-4-deoxy-L-arabinose transferase-like glycosyltransferase